MNIINITLIFMRMLNIFYHCLENLIECCG